MIAAVDVHYPARGRARAAAVLFSDYAAAAPERILSRRIPAPADYVSGAFYKRELPCILALLEDFEQMPTAMIIDGYAWLGRKPGLGQHLFAALAGSIPVIGVAKSAFAGAAAQRVFRGGSRQPLYVTASGTSAEAAARDIGRMHGPHRIPTLLGLVDRIARGQNPGAFR